MSSYCSDNGDSDSDHDMHQGGAALTSPANGYTALDSSMDDPYAFDGFSDHSSDDEADYIQHQPSTGLSHLGVPLPANIPPHLQLPVPHTLLQDNGGGPAGMGIQQEQQQPLQIQDEHDEFDELLQAHPMAISPPNAVSLGPENLDVVRFLHQWLLRQGGNALHDRAQQQYIRNSIVKLAHDDVKRVRYDDLAGDECDPQGINWQSVNATRASARKRRKATFMNYVNREGARGSTVSTQLPTHVARLSGFC